MAAGTLVSVEHYLGVSYEPDCDYVEGTLEERNVGEYDHGRLQAALLLYFSRLEKRLGVRAVPEQRLRISPTRFRVPDICVLAGKPGEQVLTQPPLACIEILSPEDRMSRTLEKIHDYLHFGVKCVWIIDPRERRAYLCDRDGSFREVADRRLRAEDLGIDVSLDELFAYMDE